MSDAMREALIALVGTPDDPNIGWRGASDREHFACEYCDQKHTDCTKIPHTPTCPVPDVFAILSTPSSEQAQPVDMVLHCPACGMQHIDAPDWRPVASQTEFAPLKWDNPPHRSHLCHGCGHIWRPADVPTNGVQAVKTKSKTDSPIASRPAAAAPVQATTAGAYLRKKADDYAMEHGHDDMGGLSFGSGAHAEAKQDYHNNLLELADELDALAGAAQGVEPVPPAVVRDLDALLRKEEMATGKARRLSRDERETLEAALSALMRFRAASPQPPSTGAEKKA